MLSAAFSNRIVPASSSTAEHASVVVLSDSQFEPSLVVLRQFVHSALEAPSSASLVNQSTTSQQNDKQARFGRQQRQRQRPRPQEEQNVVLISLEQAPERILPTSPAALLRGGREQRVRIIDATPLSGLYAPALSSSPTTRHVDLSSEYGQHDPTTLLLDAVRDSIAEMDRSARRGGGDGSSLVPPPQTQQQQQQHEAAAEDGEQKSKRPVLVVIDSVNALADELASSTTGGGGAAAAARCIKRIWETLRGRRGSRLLLVHHDDFPSFPAGGPSTSTTTTSSSSLHLLSYLLSPSLSPSTLHLTLRPSAHLELLSREYGLPADPDEIASDPRTRGYLESLGKRMVGEPWTRPERAEEDDERIQVGRLLVAGVGVGGGGGRDGSVTGARKEEEEEEAQEEDERGKGGGGGCIVEWSLRGLLEQDSSPASFGRSTRTSTRGTATPFGTSSSSNDAAGPGGSEVKRVVRMGYTAVQAVRRSGFTATATALEVREVAVGKVLDPRRMGVRAAAAGSGGGRGADQAFSSMAKPNARQSSGPTSSSVDVKSNPRSGATSATTTTTTTTPTALPFSLDLTEQQRLARSRVLNPYAGIDKPIYGEEGYQVPVVPGLGVAGGTGSTGGGIEYVADRGDDLDEEDPDEDLEL